jgi:hypothetical protein
MRAATRDLAEALSRLAGALADRASQASMATPLLSGSSRALFHARARAEAGEAGVSPRKERSEMLKELVRSCSW